MRIGDTQTDTLHVGDGQLYELAKMLSEEGRIEAHKIVVDTEQGQLIISTSADKNTVRIIQ